MLEMNRPGGALTAVWLLARVLQCENCCQSCRALIATFIECEESSQLEACPHCHFPKFKDSPCPCEEYLGQPSNPASEQWKKLRGGPVMTEAEERGWEEYGEACEEARARAEAFV